MFERLRARIILALPALLVSGCVLQFENGLFQTMTFHFTPSRDLPEGVSTLLHSAHYPSPVQLKKRWVRVSGVLVPPDGSGLPDSVEVRSEFEDVARGKTYLRLRAASGLDSAGAFSARAKLRKNLVADTLQTLSVEPRGAPLVAGTKIWLCIDLVRSKGELASLPDCGGDSGGDEPPADGVVVVEVQDNQFTPKRVRVMPGDTVRWLLTGISLNHTVTAMEESVFDSGFLTSQGAFFEVTFGAEQNDQTFEYFCRTHRSCCEMQGSVQVGANAPDPGDGY